MSVIIASIENKSALVYEGTVLCAFDGSADSSERYEALENVAGNLALKIGQEVQRESLSAPGGDWEWEEVVKANPSIFMMCSNAEVLLSLGRKLSATKHLEDEAWADAFDEVLYQADEYLFNVMKDHNLTRKTEDE